MNAKVYVFQQDQVNFHQSLPKGSTWHKHELKHETTSNQRVDELFITRQVQKSKNKNKIGLPPNKCYRLTPLARHKNANRMRVDWPSSTALVLSARRGQRGQ